MSPREQPAAKSATMIELEGLLKQRALEQTGEIPTWRADVYQVGGGTWVGHFAVLLSRGPEHWVTATLQGARGSRAGTEALTIETAKTMLGGQS